MHANDGSLCVQASPCSPAFRLRSSSTFCRHLLADLHPFYLSHPAAHLHLFVVAFFSLQTIWREDSFFTQPTKCSWQQQVWRVRASVPNRHTRITEAHERTLWMRRRMRRRCCCSISCLNPHSKSSDIITHISLWMGTIANRLQRSVERAVTDEPSTVTNTHHFSSYPLPTLSFSKSPHNSALQLTSPTLSRLL